MSLINPYGVRNSVSIDSETGNLNSLEHKNTDQWSNVQLMKRYQILLSIPKYQKAGVICTKVLN